MLNYNCNIWSLPNTLCYWILLYTLQHPRHWERTLGHDHSPHPSLTKSQDFVPKTGRRTQVSSRELHPSGHPASSSWEHLFPSALPLASPTVSVTAHLFGLHGPTSKIGPKVVTRWKIDQNLHKPLPSPTPSLNTGFPAFLSDSIFPRPTGTEIYKISMTWNGKFIYFLLGNRQGQK